MKDRDKQKINQKVFDLYDDYAHNRLDRRQFVEKLSVYAVGGLTLGTLLSSVMPNYQGNIQVKSDDSRLNTTFIDYDSPKGGGSIKAQLSKPKDNQGKLPGIIVVHENRGLNPHIADVGRRAALAGFISISPDALSPLGGYPGNDDEGRAMQRRRDRYEMLEDFIAAYEFLQNHPQCTGKVGVVGFCFGGWISNMMAVKISTLAAAVPFYGGQPSAEGTAQIKAPLLLHYAELDKRVNAGWPDYEAALKNYEIAYQAHIYPGVNHGFHNDSTGRFNKKAAELAWNRTIAFFQKELS